MTIDKHIEKIEEEIQAIVFKLTTVKAQVKRSYLQGRKEELKNARKLLLHIKKENDLK